MRKRDLDLAGPLAPITPRRSLHVGQMIGNLLRYIIAVPVLVIMQSLAPAMADCSNLPEQVQSYLRSESGWALVGVQNLASDDQNLWQKKFRNSCPGMAVVKLDRSGKSSYALALLRSYGGKISEEVVVLKQTGNYFRMIILVPPSNISFTDVPAVSVVWRSPPGVYIDVVSGRRTTVRHDVIVYEKLEAAALAYYLSKGTFKAIQTSD